MTEHIVLYGKGGVGKSTLLANTSAALVEAGFRILLLGCDHKADSCNTLNNGLQVATIFDRLQGNAKITEESIVNTGFKGVKLIESGNPYLLSGCASAEISRVFQILYEIRIFESFQPDYVLYDLPGEISCARYHQQIQNHVSQTAFVVTSADFMSLSAANDIFKILDNYGESKIPIGFGGLIPNNITSSFEESFVADFATQTNTHLLGRIPRSLVVRQSELYGKTVIEAAPLSNQAYFYRRLANLIVENSGQTGRKKHPHPMNNEELRKWANDWGNRIYALDNGLVNDGAAI